jgi:glucosamine kinase
VSVFFAGIDGGQSSTVAAIGDADGKVVGRGVAGPADEVGEGPGSTRLRDALRDALAGAARDAGLPPGQQFESVVAGVSGYEGRLLGRMPDLPARRFQLVHDAPVAHAGAFALGPGVLIVAGTGSVVYATGGGAARTTGGWGYLFGDEGSAFWIAREALAAMMAGEDDGAARPAAAAALEFFGVPSLRALARAFYAGSIARDRVAAFAPIAMRSGDFRGIVERGAYRLVALARAAIENGAFPAIAFSGGAFGDPAFRELVASGIRERVDAVQIVEPKFEPAVGALLLARQSG